MHIHSEDAIRERAYALWLEAGSHEGNDWQFWHDAERELSANGSADADENSANGAAPEQSEATH